MVNSVTSSNAYRDIRIHCVAYSVVTLLAIGLIILGTQSGQIQGLNTINSQIIIGSGCAVFAIELAIIYLRNNTNPSKNQSQATLQTDKSPLKATNIPFDGLTYYRTPLNPKQVDKIKAIILVGMSQHVLYFDEKGVETVLFTNSKAEILAENLSPDPVIMAYSECSYEFDNANCIPELVIQKALALPDSEKIQQFSVDEEDYLQPYLRNLEYVIYYDAQGRPCLLTNEVDLMLNIKADQAQIMDIKKSGREIMKAILLGRYENAQASNLTDEFPVIEGEDDESDKPDGVTPLSVSPQAVEDESDEGSEEVDE